MYYNTMYRVFDKIEDLPIYQTIVEWGESNCEPGLAYDKVVKKFKEKYWDKLKKSEQDNLIKQTKDSLDQKLAKAESVLIEAFTGKPHHSIKEYTSIANKARNKFHKLRPNVELEPVPKVKLCSSDEYKKRKAIQQKATAVIAKAQIAAIKSELLEKSLGFTTKDEGKQIDRAVMHLCNYIDEEGKNHYDEYMNLIREPIVEVPEVPVLSENPTEKELKNYNELKTMHDNFLPVQKEQIRERREILDKILSDKIKMVIDLRKPMTDEEFVEKYTNPKAMADLQTIGEIQWGNYNSIVNAFGVEPSPEIKKQLQHLSEEAVADAAYVNRLGLIANPLYAETKDVTGACKLFGYLSDANSIESIFHLANDECGLGEVFGQNIMLPEDYEEYLREGKNSYHFFVHSVDYYGVGTLGFTKDALYSTFSSVKTRNVLADAYGIEPNLLKYKDVTGRELNEREAYNEMAEGKTVKLYAGENANEARYLGNLDGGEFDTTYGCFNDPGIPANYKVDTADPEELSQTIKGLNSEIKDATHWYLRSSDEFTNFRKAMIELGKDPLDNPNEVKRKMQHIADLANAYIKMREGKGPERNSDTKARLAIARKVASGFERTLSLATPIRELERENQNQVVQEVQNNNAGGNQINQQVEKNNIILEELNNNNVNQENQANMNQENPNLQNVSNRELENQYKDEFNQEFYKDNDLPTL